MSITIPPFGSHVIKLRFTPTAEGVRQGNLTFTSNTPNSPHTIPLYGTGKVTPGGGGDTNPPDPVGNITYLSADGGKLRDKKGTGNIVQLKSINWYGLEQIGVPTGAWTRPFRTKVVGGTLREGMLDEIKRLGFNSIRLLFSQDCTWPGYKPETRNGYWNTTYINPQLNGELLTNLTQENPQAVKPTIEIIDQFVAWCEELELRIVFDMHTLAPDDSNVLATNGKWYTTAHPDDAGATAGAKREPRSEAQAIAAHVFLANRYKNRPIVCGFDIINEPHNCTWDRDPLTGVVGFYERCGKAIHAVNPDVLVICEGITVNIDHTPVGHEGEVESTTGLYQWSTWWAGKLDGVRNTQVTLNVANKVMYSPHEYGAYLMGVTMQPWFDPEGKVGSGYAGDPFPQNLPEVWRRQWGFLAEENIAPLWIGEFGSYLRIGGDPITGQGSDYNADHLAKDGEWLTYLADYCDTHNISFAYWAYPPGGDPDGLVGQAPAGTWGAAQEFKVTYLAPFITPVPVADLSVYPMAAAFGEREINGVYTLTLELRNSTASGIQINASSDSAVFTVTPDIATVPAGGVLNLTVTYDVGAEFGVTHSGNITVTYGVGGSITIPVTGSAVEEPTEPEVTPIHIDLPSNAWGITAVGDSLTEGGEYFHNGWLAKACFYSNQYLRDRGNVAVSGSQVEHARDVQLPQILAMNPPPKMCVVATGTNSIYTGTAGVEVVKEICQTLIANSIYPVLWTLPPRNDQSSMDGNYVLWNDAIKAYHRETGIPLLDGFEALRVPGSMRARPEYMNPDGLHFSNLGYTALGRYAIDSGAFTAAPTDGKIALATAAGGDNLVPNPLFTGGSGGVSNNLTLASGFIGQQLPAEAGNWQRIIRPAGLTGDNTVASMINMFAIPTGVPISLACKVRWNTGGLKGGTNMEDAAWQLGMQMMFTDATWGSFPGALQVVVGPQGDSEEEGTMFMHVTPPTGANRLIVQLMSLSDDVLAHTADISFDVSQLTVIEGNFAFNSTDPSPNPTENANALRDSNNDALLDTNSSELES